MDALTWTTSLQRKPTTPQQKQEKHRTWRCFTNFLLSSLSPEFKTKILLHQDKFHVNNKPVGTCLFKKMVQLTYVDMMATASHNQETLIEMHLKFPTTNHNVNKILSKSKILLVLYSCEQLSIIYIIYQSTYFLNILSKATLNIQESTKFIKSLKR